MLMTSYHILFEFVSRYEKLNFYHLFLVSKNKRRRVGLRIVPGSEIVISSPDQLFRPAAPRKEAPQCMLAYRPI
jgi:hypothetical protein